MPTYDYECASCGHAWEEFQQITEKPKRRCPQCRSLKAKRLIGSGAAVLFKGSGFYQTDYRSAEYKKRAKAESDAPLSSSADKAGDKKASKSTESKS